MTDYLKFNSYPSGRHEGKHHVIIVGAGIIGVCTAYYIVHHPKFDPKKYHITIVESKRVAGGASGKAGGLLALWAFPQQIVPLSFQLHQDLSDKYNGEQEWGYRRLTTVSLEGDISHLNNDSLESEEDEVEQIFETNESELVSKADLITQSKSQESVNDPVVIPSVVGERTYKQSKRHDSDSSSSLSDKPPKKTSRATRTSSAGAAAAGLEREKSTLPKDLNWITSSLIGNCSTLGGTDTTAQVHPYKFTTFMLKKAVEHSQGSIEIIIGKVSEMLYSMETGQATGVAYEPTSVRENTTAKDGEMPVVKLFGDQTVLAVGPWTSKILPDCPISGLRAHSITVAPFKDQPVSPYAIFTEFKTGPYSYISPEIYARQDEVYVCGEGDSAVDVPETTDDVEVVNSKCDELFRQVGKISPNLRKGHILKKQACYLPVLDVPSLSGPLIGETNVENLFLASGHSCWGVNNAPATGKIMSELLLDGVIALADTSGLDPSLYFDASVLVDDDYSSGSEEDAEDTTGDSAEDSSATGESEDEWSA